MITSIAKNYGNIDWNIGWFGDKSESLLELLEALKYYKFNVPTFKYVFGCPPCIFSGGRVFRTQKWDLKRVEDVIKGFNNNGIGVRFTFQNTMLEEEDLKDEYSNNLLNILNKNAVNGENGVIVYSDLLAEYIKNNYPNLTLISSLIKPAKEVGLDRDTPEYYNNLLKKFDIVVVNASRVFDEGFLEKIDDIGRIEVIVNSNCSKNCKLAPLHYDAISKANKIFALKGECEELAEVSQLEGSIYQTCKNIKQQAGMRELLSMSEEQVKWLADKGVKHFKIEGREYCDAALLSDFGRYVCEGHILYRFIDRTLA